MGTAHPTVQAARAFPISPFPTLKGTETPDRGTPSREYETGSEIIFPACKDRKSNEDLPMIKSKPSPLGIIDFDARGMDTFLFAHTRKYLDSLALDHF